VEASYYRPPSVISSSRDAPVFVRATNLSAWVPSEPPAEPAEPPPIVPPPPKRRKSPPKGPAAMRNIMAARASFPSSNASTSTLVQLTASTSSTSSGISGDLERDLAAGGLFLDGRPRDPTLLRLPTESALKPGRDSLGGGSTSVARVVHALPPKPDGASRSSDVQTLPARRESASWVAPKRERPPSPRLGYSPPPPYATPSAATPIPPPHASMESFSVPWPVTQSHFVKQIHPSNPRDALVLDQLVLGPKGSRFAAICEWPNWFRWFRNSWFPGGEWLYLWETQLPEGSELVKFKYGCQIASMAWSKDDSVVYVLTEDGQVSSAATVGLVGVIIVFCKRKLTSGRAGCIAGFSKCRGSKWGRRCAWHTPKTSLQLLFRMPCECGYSRLLASVAGIFGIGLIISVLGTWQQQTSIKRAGTTALRFVDDGDALVGGGPDGALSVQIFFLCFFSGC